MELRQLEHVLAVVEEGQFTKAAAKVHIAQSGLSASVRALERELGVTLFARTTRRVTLTEAGHAFVAEARRVVAAAQATKASVVGVRELESGTLTIGSVFSADLWYDVPRLLADFHRRYPGIELRMATAEATTLINQVADHVFDVAMVGINTELPPNVHALPLLNTHFAVALNSNHRFAQRRLIDLEAIHEELFIDFHPRSVARRITNRMFETRNLERTVSFEVFDMRSMLKFVSYGLGISCVPRPPKLTERNVTWVRLSAAPTWTLGMVTAKPESASPATRALLDLVEKRVNSSARTG